MPYSESTNTHALCDYYGHEWSKSDLLSARQSKGTIIEVCKRSGCDAARRVHVG